MTTKAFNKTRFISRDKLLNLYVTLLTDNNKVKLKGTELIKQLKDNFNYDVNEEQLDRYFEPNFYELREDRITHLKNIGIHYE